eukprot:jgi/Picsp_1/6244/NSC_03598-R1_hypothetical protein CHLNCDRAFT_57776 [Chlorella variabilis]
MLMSPCYTNSLLLEHVKLCESIGRGQRGHAAICSLHKSHKRSSFTLKASREESELEKVLAEARKLKEKHDELMGKAKQIRSRAMSTQRKQSRAEKQLQDMGEIQSILSEADFVDSFESESWFDVEEDADDGAIAEPGKEEERLRQCLKELENVLGIVPESDIDVELEKKMAEDLVGMLERGEDLPPPPAGTFMEQEESFESLLSRLEESKERFKQLVESKLKLDHLKEDDDMGTGIWDVPVISEDKNALSRPVPEIPPEIQAQYKFGQRISYILRRGYVDKSFSKPFELLQKYSLLDKDFELLNDWFSTSGVEQAVEYSRAIDQRASNVECCQLFTHFPKMRDNTASESTFCTVVADLMVKIPVPLWYKKYLKQVTSSVSDTETDAEKIAIRANLFPHHEPELSMAEEKGHAHAELFPRETDSFLCRNRQVIVSSPTLHQQQRGILNGDLHTYTINRDRKLTVPPKKKIAKYDLLPSLGIVCDKNWLVGTGPEDDSSSCQDREGCNQAAPPWGLDELPDAQDLTPDDAEYLLRSLFGSKFDEVAQQLPKKGNASEAKQTGQPTLDQDMETIDIALTCSFAVNMIQNKVVSVQVAWGWAEPGLVTYEDLPYVFAIECDLVRWLVTRG